MRKLIMLGAVLLAACDAHGPSIVATNASTDEVATKVAAAGGKVNFLSPGRWEGTMTISDMTLPNMTPQMRDAMKASLGKPTTVTSCLTPEQVKKPDFFGKGDKDCRYDHFVMSGGTIDAVAKCTGDRGLRTMSIKGTYSATSYQVETIADGDAERPMHMKMSMTAKRTGECTGKEDSE